MQILKLPSVIFLYPADILCIALFPNALSLRSCEKQRFTPIHNRQIRSLEEHDIIYFKYRFR